MSKIRAHLLPLEDCPSYMLTRAQWEALFDLYMGRLIIVARKSTMKVLGRKMLVTRQYEHDRWRITDLGRKALRSAPREFNPDK